MATKLVLTQEQKDIIACDANLIFVEAFAGGSKTTTLVKYAEARPREKMLYIAYNAAIALEAQSKFPSNVKCATINAMAYAVYGSKYRHKLGNVRAMDIKSNMGYGFVEAKSMINVLQKFLTGSHRKIEMATVFNEGFSSAAAETVKRRVEELWAKMQDPSDSMPMSHDGYLKLYHLSGEALAGYKIIMLDEKQDANPVCMDIVLQAGGRKIMVGDRHQSIYAFRGASNEVQKLAKPDKVFTLTGSFRFGSRIATLANKLLSLNGEKMAIHGLAKDEGKIDGYSFTPYMEVGAKSGQETQAYIARTNSQLFLHALDLLEAKLPFAFNKGDEKLNTILDVNNLKLGRNNLIKDAFFKKFDNLAALVEYAEQADDKEVSTLITIVKKYPNVEELIAKVRENSKTYTGKECMLTTVHSSKGKEWDTVIVADDFISLKKLKSSVQTSELRQEINCLYVQLTRAKKNLHVPAELYGFIVSLQEKNSHRDINDSRNAGQSQSGEPAVNEKPFAFGDLFK
jgi:hypothetical protein